MPIGVCPHASEGTCLHHGGVSWHERHMTLGFCYKGGNGKGMVV